MNHHTRLLAHSSPGSFVHELLPILDANPSLEEGIGGVFMTFLAHLSQSCKGRSGGILSRHFVEETASARLGPSKN